MRGELKVGVISTAQTGILPEALVLLQKEAPSLKIHLVPGVSLPLLGQVDAGEIDLALVVKPPFELQKDLRCERSLRTTGSTFEICATPLPSFKGSPAASDPI